MAKQKMTRAEKSWIMYDVGNSALVLLATSVIPIYFSSLAPDGGVVVAWSYAETVASLIIALLMLAVDPAQITKPVDQGVLLPESGDDAPAETAHRDDGPDASASDRPSGH